MKQKINLVFGIILLATGSAQAQDAYFSQFYQTSLYRNPGLVGILGGSYNAGVLYRSQWSTLGTAFNTVMASTETKVLLNKEVRDYASFGLCFINDKAGAIDYSSNDVYLAVNFNKSLEDRHNSYLSLGFTGAYKQSSFDPSKMTVDEQYELGGFNTNLPTNENFTRTSLSYIDVSAGASYNSSFGPRNANAYYLGVAAFNILRPYSSFYSSTNVKRSMRWSFNAGAIGRINETMGWLLHSDVQVQQPQTQIIAGGMLSFVGFKSGSDKKMVFSGGAFYRFNDAIIPTIKLDYAQAALTFSYDYGSSSRTFGSGSFSTYEISLYINGNSKNIPVTNGLSCPRFSNFDDY